MTGKKCLFILISLMIASPVLQAGTKEEVVRLQSDVIALRDQIREIEKTFSEKTDGLKSLVVQLNDQVAKSNLLLDRVSKMLENQTSGVQSSNEQLRQEVRALTGKIDDFATSVSALAQQMSELKVQSKALNQASESLSPDTMYDQASRDFVQGNLDLAIQEFTAYLNNYPGGDRAAAALCSIGDAYSYQNNLPQAIAVFTRVINEYPNSDKVPSALYKRAQAELSMKESENAVADFKNIVENYPETAEAALAKAELEKLGVRTSKPAKGTRRNTR
jgi:tol-pal system protein YbgF